MSAHKEGYEEASKAVLANWKRVEAAARAAGLIELAETAAYHAALIEQPKKEE